MRPCARRTRDGSSERSLSEPAVELPERGLVQAVFLQQVPESEQGGGIRRSLAPQVDANEATHSRQQCRPALPPRPLRRAWTALDAFQSQRVSGKGGDDPELGEETGTGYRCTSQ